MGAALSLLSDRPAPALPSPTPETAPDARFFDRRLAAVLRPRLAALWQAASSNGIRMCHVVLTLRTVDDDPGEAFESLKMEFETFKWCSVWRRILGGVWVWGDHGDRPHIHGAFLLPPEMTFRDVRDAWFDAGGRRRGFAHTTAVYDVDGLANYFAMQQSSRSDKTGPARRQHGFKRVRPGTLVLNTNSFDGVGEGSTAPSSLPHYATTPLHETAAASYPLAPRRTPPAARELLPVFDLAAFPERPVPVSPPSPPGVNPLRQSSWYGPPVNVVHSPQAPVPPMSPSPRRAGSWYDAIPPPKPVPAATVHSEPPVSTTPLSLIGRWVLGLFVRRQP